MEITVPRDYRRDMDIFLRHDPWRPGLSQQAALANALAEGRTGERVQPAETDGMPCLRLVGRAA